MRSTAGRTWQWIVGLLGVVLVAGCSTPGGHPELTPAGPYVSKTTDPARYQYVIGSGDTLQIFVWRNPEVSQGVTVRPDGKISTPLVEDLDASGKTPTQLARDIEKVLAKYIRDPIVTVMVGGFVGPYSEQVRVVGEAARPQSLPYRDQMTLMDVMIQVGGLTEFADGDAATLVRTVDGRQAQYAVRVDRLLKKGDISANVDILPGDILIIPESWL